MSESKKKISRRDFIHKGLAGSVAISPLSMFLSNVFADYLSKATAHAQGIEAAGLMSMFNLHMAGGPARWMWDLPLSNQATEDMGNPMLITKYGGGTNGAPGIYQSTLVNGIYLPWFWSGNLPISSGGTVAASELAHHMFMIRGVEHASDGHALNANRMLAPTPGPNLQGLVADASSRPVPSIGINGTNPYFKSAKGLSHLTAPPGLKMLSLAMAPFQQTSSAGLLINDLSLGLPLGANGPTEDVFDTFFSAMAQNAGNLQRFLPSTFLDRQNAKQLMKRNYADIATEYTTLRDKYQSLVSRALTSTEPDLKIAGVDDVAIPGNKDNPHFTMTIRDDSQDLVGFDIPIYSGADLRGIFTNQTDIVNLVDSFVLAEYMLLNNLSQSVSGFLTGRMNKLLLDSVHLNRTTGPVTLTNLLGDFFIDQHEDGAMIPLMINTRYFKAISACLFELITRLKAQNIFNDTMITMVSEFSRMPNGGSGVGTGHGYKGAPFSFINGKIDGAISIGNIGYEKQGDITLTERGIWGAAAPTIGTRTINAGNVASTVAAIVGVKSPSPNNMALAKIEGGNIIPLVTSRKNITT